METGGWNDFATGVGACFRIDSLYAYLGRRIRASSLPFRWGGWFDRCHAPQNVQPGSAIAEPTDELALNQTSNVMFSLQFYCREEQRERLTINPQDARQRVVGFYSEFVQLLATRLPFISEDGRRSIAFISRIRNSFRLPPSNQVASILWRSSSAVQPSGSSYLSS